MGLEQFLPQTSTNVATGSVTSSSATSSFTATDGHAVSKYTATIPVPTGLANVIQVTADNGFIDACVATPLGYADGTTSTCLAALSTDTTNGIFDTLIASGSPLALSSSSIVLPVNSASTTYTYSLIYQT